LANLGNTKDTVTGGGGGTTGGGGGTGGSGGSGGSSDYDPDSDREDFGNGDGGTEEEWKFPL
jgi:hypothetical protein